MGYDWKCHCQHPGAAAGPSVTPSAACPCQQLRSTAQQDPAAAGSNVCNHATEPLCRRCCSADAQLCASHRRASAPQLLPEPCSQSRVAGCRPPGRAAQPSVAWILKTSLHCKALPASAGLAKPCLDTCQLLPPSASCQPKDYTIGLLVRCLLLTGEACLQAADTESAAEHVHRGCRLVEVKLSQA